MRPDYIYCFSDFTDNKSRVEIIDQSKENAVYQLRVRVNDSEILNTNAGALTPRLADLIDLLTAVFTADWLLPRRLEETKKILVRLPCGQCSSCLLRRLSLIIAFGEDLTSYVEGPSLEESTSNHFRAMDIQAMRMDSVFNDEYPWRIWLQAYPDFRQWIPCLAQNYEREAEKVRHDILGLFHRHSQEWLNTRQFLM